MRIDAITSCTGSHFSRQLAQSLPIWLDTLDSVTVVCKPTDDRVLAMAGPSNLKIVTTTVFTDYEAYFNKGAALCLAYAESNPTDWALHFDADVLPPADWRHYVNSGAVLTKDTRRKVIVPVCPGNLFGALRSQINRRKITHDSTYRPIGFFQMWHTSDPRVFSWPLFTPHFGTAAYYDMIFMGRWPESRWHLFGFYLKHAFTDRRTWCGENSDVFVRRPREKIQAFRERTTQIVGRVLPVPPVEIEMDLPRCNFTDQEIQEILQLARQRGPFEIKINFNGKGETGTTAHSVKRAIERKHK